MLQHLSILNLFSFAQLYTRILQSWLSVGEAFISQSVFDNDYRCFVSHGSQVREDDIQVGGELDFTKHLTIGMMPPPTSPHLPPLPPTSPSPHKGLHSQKCQECSLESMLLLTKTLSLTKTLARFSTFLRLMCVLPCKIKFY